MLTKKNKRAQAWGLDLMIACIIFVIGLSVLYFYAVNYVSSSSKDLRNLFFEASIASNVLLSSEENGLFVDGKIDQDKLDLFDSLSDNEKRAVLGVSKNFYFSIDGLKVGGVLKDYVGIVNTTEVENQVQVVRIVIYENKPVKFKMIAWE